jgi:hypothetical protein
MQYVAAFNIFKGSGQKQVQHYTKLYFYATCRKNTMAYCSFLCFFSQNKWFVKICLICVILTEDDNQIVMSSCQGETTDTFLADFVS